MLLFELPKPGGQINEPDVSLNVHSEIPSQTSSASLQFGDRISIGPAHLLVLSILK
jgi:hypothetical protein